MGTRKSKFTQSTEVRRRRRFSENFKRAKVKEIESKKSRISEVSRAYEVTAVTVHRWINKYSNKTKPERTIVESKSDTQKILALQKKIADLERKLGQKQIELEFKDKMIEIAETKYGLDIKKNSGTKP